MNKVELEIWKDIPGYEGLYQVSDMGRIKSLNYMGQQGNEAILHQRVEARFGYCDVRLSKNDHRKRLNVHRLVMLAFVGESELTVNHKNKVRTDNRLENLEYMTIRDNVTYSLGTKIKVIYADGKTKEFPSAVHCAEELRCSPQAIQLIIKFLADGSRIMKNNSVAAIEACA